MEIIPDSRIDSVVEDHEKFFFIIHQATLDGSFLWDDNRLTIKHYDYKPHSDYDNDPRELINYRKIFLFFYDGLIKALSKNFNNRFHVSSDYEVIRINENINFEVGHDLALIYLPQTNQMFLYTKSDVDRRVFLTHSYVVVIPLAENN